MKKTWVIKVGSSLLTEASVGINYKHIETWANDIAAARALGIDIVVVSSGAIAEGMVRMGMNVRPKLTNELQACAAIGQMGLMQAYENAFKQYQMPSAQVLLTHEDMVNRERYLNARGTLLTLLRMDVVPIVNENDTVVIDETRFGDNDTLGALVANIVGAEKLILLTDQNGLYDKNPNLHSDAVLVTEDNANNQELLTMAQGPGSVFGSGGMRTKILAAQKAARSGCDTIIASGKEPNTLKAIMQGGNPGTLLKANQSTLPARKQWLASLLKPKGQLTLDAGAVKVIRQGGKSLLPVGVVAIEGEFSRGDMVYCVDSAGNKIASGLVNYSSEESHKIKGVSSQNIVNVLGYTIDYCYEPELIHCDNLVILA